MTTTDEPEQNTVHFNTRPQRNLSKEAAMVLAQCWYSMGYRYNVVEHDGLYDMEIAEDGLWPSAGR